LQTKTQSHDLRQILEPDSEDYNPLLNNIFCQGNVIAGVRPFWSKRRELQVYCRNLGCKALYYTFSAADMQWDDPASDAAVTTFFKARLQASGGF
jgi:hypothetical protein